MVAEAFQSEPLAPPLNHYKSELGIQALCTIVSRLFNRQDKPQPQRSPEQLQKTQNAHLLTKLHTPGNLAHTARTHTKPQPRVSVVGRWTGRAKIVDARASSLQKLKTPGKTYSPTGITKLKKRAGRRKQIRGAIKLLRAHAHLWKGGRAQTALRRSRETAQGLFRPTVANLNAPVPFWSTDQKNPRVV